MPEAVKEVVAEVSQATIKDNSPDKLPCKEVKPAEASSGTLPADEETTKDAGEGAVAPDLGQGEAPEQGKSETTGDSADASMDSKNDKPEKEVKENSTNDKTVSDKSDVIDGSVKEEKPVDESKEINSDESTSQDSKQSSPEECKIEESKQASPEQSKTEESIKAQTCNDQDKSDVKSGSENNPKEECSENKDENQPGTAEPVAKDQNDSKEVETNLKGESMDTNPEDDKKVEDTVVVNPTEEQKSAAESVKDNTVEPMEEKLDSSTQEKEKKEVAEEKHEQSIETMETTVQDSSVQESAKTNEDGTKSDKTEQNEKSKEAETDKMEIDNKLTSEEQKPQDEVPSSAVDSSSKETDSSVETSVNDVAVTSGKDADAKLEGSEKSSVKEESDTKEAKKDSEKQSDVPLENGSVDGAGSSKEVDVESAEEIKRQVREGKALLATGDNFTAADILGKACEAAGKLYGDLANENAELYYLYGCAMLECAKNENNVLGEGVKEKDDEEGASEDNQDAEGNGEEQMETEENCDGEEEKMAVDADETSKDKETADEATDKDDSEQVNTENGLDEDGKTKENSDEEEDSSLKVAWEMFELAKIAFTRMGNEERLADTYVKLAEVGLESGNKSALDDMKAALELRKKCKANPRLISETHFNLGLGFATFEMFDEAVEQFKLSKSLLEAKIDDLLKVKEEKAKEEIKDIKELLPDLEEKIQDMQESKETKLKQIQNGESSSVEKTEVSKPVSNITHLIKRKRKLEDVASDLLPNTKQQCTENSVESEESKK